MKKVFGFLIGLSFFSLLLAGCGASDSSRTTEDTRDPEIVNIYEIYRSNGGNLSYEEWLESIKGEKEGFIEGTSVSCKVDDVSYKEQTISVFAEMTAVDILDSDCSVDISELNYGKPIDNDSEYYYSGKYIYRLEVSIEGSSSLFGERIPYINFWMYPGVHMNCDGWAETSNVVFDEEGNSSYSSLFVLSYIVTGIDVARIYKR